MRWLISLGGTLRNQPAQPSLHTPSIEHLVILLLRPTFHSMLLKEITQSVNMPPSGLLASPILLGVTFQGPAHPLFTQHPLTALVSCPALPCRVLFLSISHPSWYSRYLAQKTHFIKALGRRKRRLETLDTHICQSSLNNSSSQKCSVQLSRTDLNAAGVSGTSQGACLSGEPVTRGGSPQGVPTYTFLLMRSVTWACEHRRKLLLLQHHPGKKNHTICPFPQLQTWARNRWRTC